MVGDVNLYMNDLDDPQMAEIEIMIAEPKRYQLLLSSDADEAEVLVLVPIWFPLFFWLIVYVCSFEAFQNQKFIPPCLFSL